MKTIKYFNEKFDKSTKEEQVFLRLLMRDAWYDCDMRNKSQSERKLFLQIQSKLSKELINA